MALKGLKLISLNVRSLYPHIDECYARFKDFDIICLSETWLNKSVTDEMITLTGFDLFRLDRESGAILSKTGKPKRGGGLTIYVKKDLGNFTKILSEASSVSHDLEQLWIVIDKPNVSTKIIANVYRPPIGNLSECIKELSKSTSIAQDMFNNELTIVGDFNVNYNLRHTTAFKQLKTFERNFNLAQLINTSTRHNNKNATCLDLIFTNMNHVLSSGTLDISISDHLPVFLIKKKLKQKSTSSLIKARSFANYDKQTFQEDILYHSKWADF